MPLARGTQRDRLVNTGAVKPAVINGTGLTIVTVGQPSGNARTILTAITGGAGVRVAARARAGYVDTVIDFCVASIQRAVVSIVAFGVREATPAILDLLVIAAPARRTGIDCAIVVVIAFGDRLAKLSSRRVHAASQPIAGILGTVDSVVAGYARINTFPFRGARINGACVVVVALGIHRTRARHGVDAPEAGDAVVGGAVVTVGTVNRRENALTGDDVAEIDGALGRIDAFGVRLATSATRNPDISTLACRGAAGVGGAGILIIAIQIRDFTLRRHAIARAGNNLAACDLARLGRAIVIRPALGLADAEMPANAVFPAFVGRADVVVGTFLVPRARVATS